MGVGRMLLVTWPITWWSTPPCTLGLCQPEDSTSEVLILITRRWRSTDNPLYPLDPCSFCHLELVERSLFYLSFSRSLREKDQKRGATPKAPFKGGCKRESRTTDDSRASLVSRDTRCSLLHPCCRRPLERDSQVRGECFYRLAQEDNPRGTVISTVVERSLGKLGMTE